MFPYPCGQMSESFANIGPDLIGALRLASLSEYNRR